ncbi:MAG: hypothetical protein AVDCRST_MAG18-239 [uncultured Thermomicrobiales bacterium]|uniref:Uncharacterized protein n=1 Tax=uncultured Thermomicrobiales bacterium TaxID=1645740 RepID=A0A6J4UI19_9BACT|nr:MAG: hypothetical protein AVDCRST_MAG18-239 [uncultured Thermomicrobiales bacterium]
MGLIRQRRHPLAHKLWGCSVGEGRVLTLAIVTLIVLVVAALSLLLWPDES